MNKSFDIIIQARLDSKRLPNKSLLPLSHKPIIDWVYEGVNKSKLKNKIIFAIPNTKKNDLLFHYLNNKKYNIYRGSLNNVLDRFYKTAKKFSSKNIVRVCADNPFVSGFEIDKLYNKFISGNFDYAYNHRPIKNSYPDGLGAEIVTYNCLSYLNKIVKSKKNKEHIFNYILENQKKFKIHTFNPAKSLSYPKIKLDIDTYEDLIKFTKIVPKKNFNVIELLNKLELIYGYN